MRRLLRLRGVARWVRIIRSAVCKRLDLLDFAMIEPYKTRRRVEFRDTDAARMAHFSMFFVYMEQAEHELWRHLGLSIVLEDDKGPISFPRVAARCDYQRAVKFEDVLDIEVAIVRLGAKSITYEFNFSHDGRPVASGQTTTVCCRFFADGTPKSISIPAWIVEKLEQAVVP
jgi:acyl-CoA thioester hydrolase